jgi:hypothetical protein
VITCYIAREVLSSKDKGIITEEPLNLVDLAGSENLAKFTMEGDRLAEGITINHSLLSLNLAILRLTRGTQPIPNSTLI